LGLAQRNGVERRQARKQRLRTELQVELHIELDIELHIGEGRSFDFSFSANIGA
jgi:hypothetical protein